jgi:hypothetical protein
MADFGQATKQQTESFDDLEGKYLILALLRISWRKLGIFLM